ncbi:hypothetical protein Smp_177110 [Schistosoma mansoni]|uniref:hypothetical protein n=1 Tax=Schistosoma mansoni TaxID=6183 RepID=UPI00022DC826|nr:hypothetical protein Smp_177110 [Schistosoma mansoni]|eukprot:XP_018651557.1 hypothetical protein Smp_177110 [Schistosoma mansoni]
MVRGNQQKTYRFPAIRHKSSRTAYNPDGIDDTCIHREATIIDFKRPTDVEIQTKSGYRNVTDTCGIWIKNPSKGLRSRRPE